MLYTIAIMKTDFEFIELFEIYKDLLTERQRELFSSHYLYDLSLSEIALPDNLSRQSVYDGVKKVKQKLLEYEKTLKLKEKFSQLSEVALSLDETTKQKVLDIIGK